MIISAIYTNSISNALHAFFLFAYFIAAIIHYIRSDYHFSLMIVLFFLTLFLLKILGVYVHYMPGNEGLSAAWIGISLLTIMLNYFVVSGMAMPDLARISVMFLSVLFSFLFITNEGNFLYIALPVMLVYSIAAYYSSSMLRAGFIMVVLSNIFWIAARSIAEYWLGHPIAPEYRYDNDVYHVLLIISTFVIYKAVAKGYWKTPLDHV